MDSGKSTGLTVPTMAELQQAIEGQGRKGFDIRSLHQLVNGELVIRIELSDRRSEVWMINPRTKTLHLAT